MPAPRGAFVTTPATRSPYRRRSRAALSAAASACALAALFAAWSIYLVSATVHEMIRPESSRPGDLYLGDGSGFVLAAVCAVPAFALGLVTVFWFKRWREASTGFERFLAVPTAVAASTVLILMVSGAVRAG